MRHALGLLVALAPLALPAAAFAAPMVSDASFEAVATGSSGYVYTPTDTGAWTFQNDSGVVSNGSGFGFANAPDGTKAAFVQSYFGSSSSALSETISGLTVGTSYTVSFDLAGRPGSGFGADPVLVAVGGVNLGTYTPTTAGYSAFTTQSFTAAATSTTLAFLGTAGAASQDLATAIDLVSVTASGAATAVPEPASMALLGAGVLGVLGLRRRRTGGGLAA